MSTGAPSQLREGRDGQQQLYLLVNQLRRWLPGPAMLIPAVTFSLLAETQTIVIPANVNGWVTTGAFLASTTLTGAIAVLPNMSVGSNATFDNIVAVNSPALVTGQVTTLTVITPFIYPTDIVYVDVSLAALGPTEYTATLYLQGFYR